MDHELTAETGAGADSLGQILYKMEPKMEWDNTGARVCILASLTYYFVIWNLQCRIWASFAQIEAAKGDKLDSTRYEEFITTFRMRTRKMKNELSSRSSRVRQLYADQKKARMEQVKWFEPYKESSPAFVENNNITTTCKFTDEYTGKEYRTVAPMSWWAHYSSDEQIATTKAEKEKEYNQYKADLEDFATRAISGDLKVIDQWADIVREAELLLLPPAPKVPATVDVSTAAFQSKAFAKTISALSTNRERQGAPVPQRCALGLIRLRSRHK